MHSSNPPGSSCNVARKSGRTARSQSPPPGIPTGEANQRTKNNRPRSPRPKPTITAQRLALRDTIWTQARSRIRDYVAERKGNARAMALALGIAPSQVHRYLCEDCEHDQEPSFTIGTAMLLYIQSQSQTHITDV